MGSRLAPLQAGENTTFAPKGWKGIELGWNHVSHASRPVLGEGIFVLWLVTTSGDAGSQQLGRGERT
jgi:hypothetical protein